MNPTDLLGLEDVAKGLHEDAMTWEAKHKAWKLDQRSEEWITLAYAKFEAYRDAARRLDSYLRVIKMLRGVS